MHNSHQTEFHQLCLNQLLYYNCRFPKKVTFWMMSGLWDPGILCLPISCVCLLCETAFKFEIHNKKTHDH